MRFLFLEERVADSKFAGCGELKDSLTFNISELVLSYNDIEANMTISSEFKTEDSFENLYLINTNIDCP